MNKERKNVDELTKHTVQLLHELLGYEFEINDGHTVLVEKWLKERWRYDNLHNFIDDISNGLLHYHIFGWLCHINNMGNWEGNFMGTNQKNSYVEELKADLLIRMREYIKMTC